MTKASLKALNPAPNVIELNLLDDGAERQQMLMKLSGQRTVPNIFIGGKHFGGNSDLQDGIASGKVK